MEEIKKNEYVRTTDGKIGVFVRYSSRKDDSIYKSPFNCFIRLQNRKSNMQCCREYIVKHSPNLIDLIQCGDYVNGYKVVETYKDKQLNGWQVGKSKEDEIWLGVVVSSKMIKEPLQEYFDNEMIKTIVTKEQFESISYKVKE